MRSESGRTGASRKSPWIGPVELSLIAGAFLAMAQGVAAQERTAAPEISGYGAFHAGQIVEGQSATEKLEKVWIEGACAGIQLKKDITDRAKVVVGLEGNLAFSYLINPNPNDFNAINTRIPGFGLRIPNAYGSYRFLDPEKFPLVITAGLFEYKYNPEVRNLGEYLFRSYTYPQYLINNFDYAMKRLLGFKVSSTLFGTVRQDLLFTSETDLYPLQDFSLAYVADVSLLKKAVTIGAGVNFDRLFPVDPKKTTPHNSFKLDTLKNPDGTYVVDSLGGYSYDSTFYTFAGTKLMCRLTLDPKPLFGNPRFFGPEDLKIYGELDIIGVANQEGLYDTLSKRMPWTIGIHVPCFKVLDCLAAEVEFNSPRPNSFRKVFSTEVPEPNNDQYDKMYGDGTVRWSFFAEKKVLSLFTLRAQVAYDHMRPIHLQNDKMETADVMSKDEHWWWVAKVQYDF